MFRGTRTIFFVHYIKDLLRNSLKVTCHDLMTTGVYNGQKIVIITVKMRTIAHKESALKESY